MGIAERLATPQAIPLTPPEREGVRMVNPHPDSLAENAYVRKVLHETGLMDDFISMGRKVAELMVDLFADVEPGSELFEQFSFIDADDLPEFNKLLQNSRKNGAEHLPDDDRRRLISLPFKLIIARHRLGQQPVDFGHVKGLGQPLVGGAVGVDDAAHGKVGRVSPGPGRSHRAERLGAPR